MNPSPLRVIGGGRSIATKGAKMVQRIFLLFLLLTCASAGAAFAQNAASISDVAADRAKSDALTPARREQARNLFEQGFEDLRSGDYRAARLGFEQGLAIDPGNSMANLYMAETLARLGDDARAREFYNRVAALDPGSAEARQAEAGLEDLDIARMDAANRMVLVASIKAPFKTFSGFEMYVKNTPSTAAIFCVRLYGEVYSKNDDASTSCLVAKKIEEKLPIRATIRAFRQFAALSGVEAPATPYAVRPLRNDLGMWGKQK
jgi:tetratricopeptide (TPR) repeat protein